MHHDNMRYYAALLFAALAGCGLSNGKCELPGSEKEIRDSLAINLIARTFASEHVTDKIPQAYLHENPECCSVKPMKVSLWDTIVWDRYSLPKYKVEVSAGYRAAGNTYVYESFGNGDSCGRVADTFGMEHIIEGLESPSICRSTDLKRQAGKIPVICAADSNARDPSVSVSMVEIGKMVQVNKAEATALYAN
ncbi:hypothetical protein GGR39_003391 [Novosphingobium fluoreni]|uniref:Lipoprotein n=1 Tax=Novosphingobium fluoreni TaxID=1391222 RepID=A0A7W6C6Z4_9SPHN|nr:hypothetical protein [Novosphingobium fluoreni]MBB3941710.1 hypothetical protein [Novosphingobium fluoreni]